MRPMRCTAGRSCLHLLLCLAACDDGGGLAPDAGFPDASIRPIGPLTLTVESDCQTPVVRAGDQAVVSARSLAPDGSLTELRVAEGPALVDGDAAAMAPHTGGAARFTLTCEGFGRARLVATDAQQRVAAVDLLCARPSEYTRACASGLPPRPSGDWRVEQTHPTGPRGRRLSPRGISFGGLGWQVPLRLRLVFDGGQRPETAGEVSVEVLPGSAAGVTVEPDTAFTTPGTGEVELTLSAGADPGEFRLQYTARLDGEVRTATSEPFVVTRPPPGHVALDCDAPERPRPVFDEGSGLRPDGPAVACTLRSARDGEAAVGGGRAWIVTEAGRASVARATLDETGEVPFLLVPGDRPPVDAEPRGPSPLDGLVTVVGIVEGSEPDDTNAHGFADLDEPYVDSNDNGAYDPGERFFDTNGDGVWTPANGERDEYALIWTSVRLRWVGPLADDERALTLDCREPHCSRTPVPGFHDHCPPDAFAYLLPDAVVDGAVLLADRRGQCIAEGGAATLFVEPERWAVFDGPTDVPLGPCPLTGHSPTPFTLRLKGVAHGPFLLMVALPDGGLLERTLCAP